MLNKPADENHKTVNQHRSAQTLNQQLKWITSIISQQYSIVWGNSGPPDVHVNATWHKSSTQTPLKIKRTHAPRCAAATRPKNVWLRWTGQRTDAWVTGPRVSRWNTALKPRSVSPNASVSGRLVQNNSECDELFAITPSRTLSPQDVVRKHLQASCSVWQPWTLQRAGEEEEVSAVVSRAGWGY